MKPFAIHKNVNALIAPWFKGADRMHLGPAGIFKRVPLTLLVLALLLQIICGCTRLMYHGLGVNLAYYEGDYHGKVIDAETMLPIEGAVVLGVWSSEYGTAAGPVYEYYDARETVTDENGEFTINGMGPRAVTHLQKMRLTIFKVGYEDIVQTEWDSLKTDSYFTDTVRWEGDKAFISLRLLPIEKRLRRLTPYVGGEVPLEKQKKMREEFEREYQEIKEERHRINGKK